ncbi:MAG TPA: hypothetical protein PJ984_02745 [Candidatus Saccharibacteria bacterium]|nr:hypothetical protein [Candidatus Saccharibacteria bacterium]
MVRNKFTKKIVALLPLVALFSGLLFAGHSIAQQSTQVGAVLCTIESPDLQIAQPISDSVTNTPTVQIEGTALYTSQIDVVLNGQYSNSVAIGFDSVLQTQISLQEGTNTITLQAYFSCNGTSAEVDIIVDYQPTVIPSVPNNIDTAVVTSGAEVTERTQDGRLSSFVAQLSEDIKEKLGLEKASDDPNFTENRSYVSITFNWITFLAILALLGTLFASQTVIAKLVTLLGLNRWSVRHSHKLLRFIIALLIILLATIFSFS